MAAATDKWSAWLLEKRFGGNAEAAERGMRELYRVRDSIVDEAKVAAGETVLDVGCGDGLVAFAAVDRVGDAGRVIFSDISEPLIERCRELAAELGVLGRCRFAGAAADDLGPIATASVDVVTTRSVLIYVRDKARAFAEFHRVLRPGGRASVWEPINRFNALQDPGHAFGERMPEIAHLWGRFAAYMRTLQPLDSDPMMDFDERDLLRYAEEAGFAPVHMSFHVRMRHAEPMNWDAWMSMSGNPNIPTTREMLNEVFSEDEFTLFERHARPQLERGGAPTWSAFATVVATKG